ncbi:hypothetical protein HK102_005083 [Quaeritorhiza haematococci]|nr:hypothetical protein HK102_005083 [Quaeritorhiza haematococci]
MHPIAAKGFTIDSPTYETFRPSYPPAVLDLLSKTILPSLSNPSSAQTLSILDLAAGTGKFTRLLLPFNPKRLEAVEPSPTMRSEFMLLVPQVPIHAGTATSIPFEDQSFDLVTVAQAFHWFANDAALTEIHRVLKPNGKLVLVWNLEDSERAAWVRQLREAYQRYEAGSPQYWRGLWRRVFSTDETSTGAFSKLYIPPLKERQIEWMMPCTRDQIWGRILSKSYVAILGEEEHERLKGEVEEILDGEDVRWYGDGLGRTVVDYPYTTDVVWVERR